MHTLDWLIIGVAMVGIVVYGVLRGRGSKDIQGYLLSDRSMRWSTIALSIMATQASAITFLSTPGQAYDDGMRFVQMYLGLPIAMVVLAAVVVPLYHRLKVYTAYEFLEDRFDLKTRGIAAAFFLFQRGLAAGLTIVAPAIILSVILGWNLTTTNVAVGALVIVYTAAGGTKAVARTQFQQMVVITIGMVAAFVVVLARLPEGVGLVDATRVAGALGRLNAIDLSFDPTNRYNIWSGVIGGFFLAMSYFGTDQSQVQRYLTGRSVTQSRLGLLFNGLAKVPMQFSILFLGAMVFVFYQFVQPPVFFNPVAVERVQQGPEAGRFAALEERYAETFEEKRRRVEGYVAAERQDDPAAVARARGEMLEADAALSEIRGEAIELLVAGDPELDPSDTNYVFLTFVTRYLPVGLVGLLIAAILFASMSSTSAELNALASTTVVDVYRRVVRKEASDRHYLVVSKLATVAWGIYAILFAQYVSKLGSLVEAVNILGSVFYGPILGIFLLAFFTRRIGGTATFVAAALAEVGVVLCFRYTEVAYLWYNVIGCLLVMGIAFLLNPFFPDGRRAQA